MANITDTINKTKTLRKSVLSKVSKARRFSLPIILRAAQPLGLKFLFSLFPPLKNYISQLSSDITELEALLIALGEENIRLKADLERQTIVTKGYQALDELLSSKLSEHGLSDIFQLSETMGTTKLSYDGGWRTEPGSSNDDIFSISGWGIDNDAKSSFKAILVHDSKAILYYGAPNIIMADIADQHGIKDQKIGFEFALPRQPNGDVTVLGIGATLQLCRISLVEQ